VEGEWKNFVFKMAEPIHAKIILEHMRKNFYRDEPLCKGVGYDDDMADDFDELIVQVLPDKLSFIALEKGSDKVAGVRLTTITKKSHHGRPKPVLKSRKTAMILSFLTELTAKSKICETYGIDHYADFFMTSVDAEFRGQGLVTEMYRRSIALLTSKNLPVAKSVFSSPFTRKAATKLQFCELARLYLSEAKYEDGTKAYPDAGEDEFASVMALKLN